MWRGNDKANFASETLLALGSNNGDREKNIASALRLLKIGGQILEISSLYETASLLRDEQPPYLNLVCLLETQLDPRALIDLIHDIEDSLGRDRLVKIWGERTIDIDIIDFDGVVMNEDDIVIPHKEMTNRSFVLYPLGEIVPDYIHPIMGKNIGELIASIADDLGIKKFKDSSKIFL